MPVDPITWLDKYGDQLFKFAMTRVRNRDTAEDLVQETLIAAIQNMDQFRGESTEKTWLIGILKNKIIDHIRKENREVVLEMEALEAKLNSEDNFNLMGRWRSKIRSWNSPDKSFESEEFWNILKTCLNELPQNLATFFMLREIDGLTTNELCDVIGMKPNNVWTTLSRVRMKLRACFDKQWLDE